MPYWYNSDTGEASFRTPKIITEQEKFATALERGYNAMPSNIMLTILSYLQPLPDRIRYSAYPLHSTPRPVGKECIVQCSAVFLPDHRPLTIDHAVVGWQVLGGVRALERSGSRRLLQEVRAARGVRGARPRPRRTAEGGGGPAPAPRQHLRLHPRCAGERAARRRHRAERRPLLGGLAPGESGRAHHPRPIQRVCDGQRQQSARQRGGQRRLLEVRRGAAGPAGRGGVRPVRRARWLLHAQVSEANRRTISDSRGSRTTIGIVSSLLF